MLDVQSTNKGVLIPRMTKAQRVSIDSPTAGILVFQTDATSGFYFFSGSVWSMVDDPCGSYQVPYGNRTYHTIRIGSQCWLRENLDIGDPIAVNQDQLDNGIIEKYCQNLNDGWPCGVYGGLYQWDEMMQYGTTEGAQGICPSGWHVPSDNEWKILEGNMDSMYGTSDPFWNYTGSRGYDAGKNMKSIMDFWNTPSSNIDMMGFRALPGGMSSTSGIGGLGEQAYFWTSTLHNPVWAYFRSINDGGNGDVNRNYQTKTRGCSVRCIRD